MAGDYIPITDELQGRREVAIIARATGRDLLNVLGGLQVFWLWAQKETATGALPGMVLDDLPRMIPLLQIDFFEALTRPDVKWLVVKPEGLLLPRFGRWLGNAAKKRLKDRDKKRKQRDRDPREYVPHLSPRGRDRPGDKSGTHAGPEESRGEERKNKREGRSRGTPLPPDFFLTPERARAAEREGVADPPGEFAHFRDHYAARGTVFRDWDAAWRKWLGKAKQFTSRQAGALAPPSTSTNLPRYKRCRRCGHQHVFKAGEPEVCTGVDWRESA